MADFAGTPATVKELERNYRIDDRIIRYHTVKKADQVNLEALQAEIAARAQAARPPEPEPAPATAEAAPAPEAPPEAAAAPPETAAPAEQTPAPAKED